jgi:predicted nucleotidyltransferase
MRLTPAQIDTIRQAATTAFGQGTSVWLFGSRVDDTKKGGDIDLLVCPNTRTSEAGTNSTNLNDEAKPQPSFMQKIKMLNLLEQQLGERKIDIVVEHPQDLRPIVEVAHTTGIRLQ